jgi:uncharacterized protein with HEPN domain
MKGKISDKERINPILDAISNIEDFTHNITFEQYMDDLKLRLAIAKLFEIIGEAVASISEVTKRNHPDIEWTIIKSVRNILVHEYFGIDYKVIWYSIQENIPTLKNRLQEILSDFE